MILTNNSIEGLLDGNAGRGPAEVLKIVIGVTVRGFL